MTGGDGKIAIERDGRTTTDEVRRTYYGMPVIKAPHWRWLVINYFFLAAIAGGTFTIATIADLFSQDRALVRAGRYLSLAAGLPSPLLLSLDLGRPERAVHMFRILKLRSPMSLGSWALLAVGLMSGLSTVLQLLTDLMGQDFLFGLRRALGILGLPFSLFIAGYSGVLLAATNVPLWARNYLLLGPTFIASAFSSSLSLLSLVLALGGSERKDTGERLARAEMVALTGELFLVVAGVIRLGRLGKPLTSGLYGLLFWPLSFVGGMVVPLLLQTLSLGRGKQGHTLRLTSAGLVLMGGYVLRMLMILAGRKSANIPEDYFEYTRTKL